MAGDRARRHAAGVGAPTITMMPQQFAAGTTVKYSRGFADYTPGDGWTLAVHLAGASIITATVAADVSGSTWNVTLTAAVTGVLKAGVYQWRELVTKSSETYVAASGAVTVLPNIATAVAGDFQTFAERMLAAIEAVLVGRIPADVESYQIAGRSLTRIPVMELQELRARYQGEVAAQRKPGTFGTTIYGRFAEEV